MSKWRDVTRRAAVTMLCGTLTACSLGPKATEQPATYDLGAPRSQPVAAAGITAVIFVPEITSPAWLSGPGIVYRLNYENAARPQPYALSRWSASPALLLTERLRARLAAATANGIVAGLDGVKADYVLRIELEDFSQSFDAPNSSRVALRARASLVRLPDRILVTQRTFAVDQAAPTADAPGAVQALNVATEEFLGDVVKWTEERLKAAGGESPQHTSSATGKRMATIFSKIIAREIPADIVYEDDLCLAFRDVNPQAPVHVLVIPKREIARLVDATAEDQALLGHLVLAANKVATQLGVGDAFRLVVNNGANAGQSVFHVHLHILAGRGFRWPPG